jgi:hypothetical protein
MIKDFHFRLDELTINQEEVKAVLGYEGHDLPAPFDGYFKEVWAFMQELPDIRASYRIIENIQLDESRQSVSAAGIDFEVGRTVYDELLGSERLAFFVSTAGKIISDRSIELLKGDDPVLGYVYDVFGSALAEAASERMQNLLKKSVEKNSHKITNRYSPGYCSWHVSDQHKLFSLFDGNPCGVSLTPSALMQPVKSVSGLIGIGKQVIYREHQCTLCMSKNCLYKRIRRL